MRDRERPSFGGFHAHCGDVVACRGSRAEISAELHAFLVREAERLGCRWLASLRHSHPDQLSAVAPADEVFRELDRLLGDPTVDDRARVAAHRLRDLQDASGSTGTAFVACGVGDGPFVEHGWDHPPPAGTREVYPAMRPLIVMVPTPTTTREDAEVPVPDSSPHPDFLRFEFFPEGTVFRGPCTVYSRRADVRGCSFASVTAGLGLDLRNPQSGALCIVQGSADGKSWADVSDRVTPGLGRWTTATFPLLQSWIRVVVEIAGDGEVPLSVIATCHRRPE